MRARTPSRLEAAAAPSRTPLCSPLNTLYTPQQTPTKCKQGTYGYGGYSYGYGYGGYGYGGYGYGGYGGYGGRAQVRSTGADFDLGATDFVLPASLAGAAADDGAPQGATISVRVPAGAAASDAGAGGGARAARGAAAGALLGSALLLAAAALAP